MVRLRSNRWYSGDGQRRVRRAVASQNLGYRRLVSLCLLLALVLVLMQRAADPKYLSQAFRVLGVPLEGESLEQESGAAPPRSAGDSRRDPGWSVDDSGNPDSKSLAWRVTCDDLVPRLLSSATARQTDCLAQRWQQRVLKAASEPGEQPTEPGATETDYSLQSLFAASRKQLEQLQANLGQPSSESSGLEEDELADARAQRDGQAAISLDWEVQMRKFILEWRQLEQLLLSEASEARSKVELQTQLSSELGRAVTEWLDEKMLAAMRDGSPWRAKELTAFRWWLTRTGQGSVSWHSPDATPASLAGPLLNTLQLEAEHQRYRGHIVRFRGSIRRLEEKSISQAEAPGDSYWLMWLRGEDNAPQPIAVYASQPVIDQTEFGLQPAENVDVEVTGLLGKRLAYASTAGLQVAPTLFATDIAPNAAAGQAYMVPPMATATQFGMAVLLGSIVAAFILLPILWQWRRGRPLAHGLRTTRQHTRQPRKGRAEHSLFVVLFSLASMSFGLITAFAQQVQPPWAATVDRGQQKLAMFEQRVSAAISADERQAMKAFLDGDRAEIPTPLLQVIHALKQLDWRPTEENVSYPRLAEFDMAGSWSLDFPEADLRVESLNCFGVVRLAMPVALSLEQELWFQESDSDKLFRLMLADVQPEVVEQHVGGPILPVLTADCPLDWIEAARLRQPMAISGVGLRSISDQRWLCVLAERPQWRLDLDFPASVDIRGDSLSPRLGPSLQVLSRSGFDLSAVDVVRRNNQRSLQPEESQALYSLLRITSEPSFAIEELGSEEWGPIQVMADAKGAFAKPIEWNVRLVGGSVVPVDSQEDQRFLGSKRYFQYDGFVDLGNQRIRYQVDGREFNFDREFPVTIVSREMTPFVPQKKVESGELSWSIGKYARVRGCFYRLWSYDSELLQQQTAGGRQAAPLVVASEMRIGRPRLVASESRQIGWFGYALCVATLFILAIILLQAFRYDSRRIFRRSA